MSAKPAILAFLATVVLFTMVIQLAPTSPLDEAEGQVTGSPETSPSAKALEGQGDEPHVSSTPSTRSSRESAPNLLLPEGITGTPVVLLFPSGLAPAPAGAVQRGAVSATVSHDRYEFSSQLDSGVIVGTCEGCTPLVMALKGSEWPVLAFKGSEPWEVRTQSTDGEPIPMAELTIWARTEFGWWPRELTSERDGSVSVDTLASSHEVVARKGPLVSAAWNGTPEPQAATTLILTGAFRASGTVDSAEVGSRVTVRHYRGAPAVLGEAEVGTDGRWYMDEVPWSDQEFVFRIEAHDARTDETFVRPLSAGSDVQVEFELSEGYAMPVLITCDGQPVAGVSVTPIWRKNIAAFDGQSMVTDEHGHADLIGIRPGRIAIRVEKEGYTQLTDGPHTYTEVATERYEIQIQRGGILEGHVLHEGEPVEEFEIRAWNIAGDPFRESFHSESGEYRCTSLPLGEVYITACSEDLPLSVPVKVTVSPDRAISHDFELGSTLLARGTVVDAATGRPLPGVRVEGGVCTDGGHIISNAGPVELTGKDGTFSGIPVPQNFGFVQFDKGSYSQLLEVAPKGPGEQGVVDLGFIALAELQDLKVQLLSDQAQDMTEFRVGFEGKNSHAPQRADENGQVLLEGIDAGPGYISVYIPGSRIDQECYLLPGADWTYSIPVQTSRSVEVEVLPADGEELPKNLWLGGTFHSPDELPYCAFALVDSGVAHLEIVGGTQGVLEIVTQSGVTLINKVVSLHDGVNRFRWKLSGHRHRYRLVDPAGKPYVGMYVDVGVPGDPIGGRRASVTDEQGEFTTGDVGEGQVSLLVLGTEILSREIVVEPPSSPDEVRVITLDTRASIQVRVLEEGMPVSGIQVVFTPGLPQSRRDTKTTNEHGLVTKTHLQPGPYEVEVRGAGWWETHHTLEASLEAPPFEVVVRRRGSVDVTFRADGLPLVGGELKLTSLTPGDDVQAWLAERRVRIFESSDAAGEWALEGLPVGRYRWEMTHSSGAWNGELSVSPGATSLQVAL